MTATHALADAVGALIGRQLRGYEIAYCWHRIRIATADGRTAPTESAMAVAQEGTEQ